jgi:hypothetical protein
VEKSFSPKIKILELQKLTLGSLNYLDVHQPQKIIGCHSMGSRGLTPKGLNVPGVTKPNFGNFT